jgi:phosphoribosylaminoimidazolecarboxamide formyltransferase/IMP cyclohydrolase
MPLPVRRALLSVSDKTGLLELSRELIARGIEILSTGGTARLLTAHGVPVREVDSYTGFPEIMDGRLKTLHPKIHGGLLGRRGIDDAVMAQHAILPIDLLVVNLYPFAATVGRPGCSYTEAIEHIDIGGPAMLRAAAKNHESVLVVVDPQDYPLLLQELDSHAGGTDALTRARYAAKAFAHTARYDTMVAAYLAARHALATAPFPGTLPLIFEKLQDLRYGENPHQHGARYRNIGERGWWDTVVQHSGLELSYLNLYDGEAAWQLVHDLSQMRDQPAAAIIKHANPCGAAVADDLATAYRLAFEGDERSAFGGIVAVSAPIDDATCDAIVAAAQADVIIAPGYGPGCLERLRAKRKNTRLLEADEPPSAPKLELRQISGGFLVQDAHHFASKRSDWRVVTKAAPTAEQWADAELAWRICGHVKSNAIVLVANGQAVGIGAGQQNRVESGQIAASKAAGRAKGGACASDAFYPFPDGVEAAAAAGVAVVVQPGGSLRDDEVTAKADELGLAMVFTGERHFLH